MEYESSSASETDVVRKKDKIRSAWISFVGRITAQIIGAIATVGLGVIVLNGHFSGAAPAASGPSNQPTSEQNVLIATPVRTERETVIVLMPLDSVSKLSPKDIVRLAKAAVTDLSQAADGQAIRKDPTGLQ